MTEKQEKQQQKPWVTKGIKKTSRPRDKIHKQRKTATEALGNQGNKKISR